jgi:hypothetical protein
LLFCSHRPIEGIQCTLSVVSDYYSSNAHYFVQESDGCSRLYCFDYFANLTQFVTSNYTCPNTCSIGHASLPAPELCNLNLALLWSRPLTCSTPFRPRNTACTKTVCVAALLLIAGDIELNPGPPLSTSNLQFGLININSVRCKAPLVHDLISDHCLDILALTETRLQADMPNAIKLDPAPPGYSIHHVHRSLTASHPLGGGVAVIHRDCLSVSPISCALSPTSFELQLVRFTSVTPPITAAIIYRPPDSSKSLFCR